MERNKLYVLKCVGVRTIQSVRIAEQSSSKMWGHPARCPVCKALIKYPGDDIE